MPDSLQVFITIGGLLSPHRHKTVVAIAVPPWSYIDPASLATKPPAQVRSGGRVGLAGSGARAFVTRADVPDMRLDQRLRSRRFSLASGRSRGSMPPMRPSQAGVDTFISDLRSALTTLTDSADSGVDTDGS